MAPHSPIKSPSPLKWVDTHAHLTSDEIYPELEQVIQRARSSGIERIVNICTNATTLKRGIEIAKTHPWIYNVAATTPHDANQQVDDFFSLVEQAVFKGELVAIGETGLDYYYKDLSRELQEKYLLRYFALAKRAHLPVVFHCREAFQALFELSDSHYLQHPALLHCFTGTQEEAKGVLDRGWYLSMSGIVTFKKSQDLREVVSYVPLERLMLETDAPFLAPQQKRGKQNEPAFMIETAQMIAQIKGISVEQLSEQMWKNAIDFFSFSKLP